MIDISVRSMRAMVALDELRSFSLAAERCHVTQSALSQLVGKLEVSVGVQLVDRDRRHVALTAEGHRFVATAKRILQELNDIESDLREHAAARTGRVGIAAAISLSAYWLPRLIAKYRVQFPGIQLNLFDVSPPQVLELLRNRQADFGLSSEGPARSGVEARLLFTEKFVVACHKKHALATKTRLTPLDLEGQPFIRLARSGSLAQYLEASLRGMKLVDSGFEVHQLETVAGLVANDLGITVVPESTIPYFDSKLVATVPLAARGLSRPIYFVQPTGRQLSTAAREFLKLLESSELVTAATVARCVR